MNNSFLKFNEAALKSGFLQFDSALAQQLKSVTESFVSLAKSAEEGHAEEEGEEEEVDESIEKIPVRTNQAQPTPPRRVDVGWGYSTSHNHSPPQQTAPSPPEEPQTEIYGDLPLLPNFNAEQAKQGGLHGHTRLSMSDPASSHCHSGFLTS
jgi:hypothetical protein